MAKTIEALQRAEKERKLLTGEFNLPTRITGLKAASQVETESRRLKHNLLQLIPEKDVKTILFAGCSGGEGASTVVANFASALASGGETVLLVDANLRSPSLHTFFNIGIENGLTDLLSGSSLFASVIKETQISNLLVISGGTSHPNPIILLESDSLGSKVAAMKQVASWVLFDAPPLTRFMEAFVLAPTVDGVVVVVEAEKTRWEVAESVRQRVISGNGNILGVVLNKRRYRVPTWLYKRS